MAKTNCTNIRIEQYEWGCKALNRRTVLGGAIATIGLALLPTESFGNSRRDQQIQYLLEHYHSLPEREQSAMVKVVERIHKTTNSNQIIRIARANDCTDWVELLEYFPLNGGVA